MSRLAAIDVGREAARQAARAELSDRRYRAAQPPLAARIIGAALRSLGRLLARAAEAAPGGRLGLLLLLVLLVLLAAVVFVRLGPPARRRRSPALFAAGGPLAADDHRARAEQAAREGRWAEAVRERLRAVVRELEVRNVLEPRPGRTAREVAVDGGAAVPSLAAGLERAAVLFDEIWYGGRAADAAGYDAIVALDAAVRGERRPASAGRS